MASLIGLEAAGGPGLVGRDVELSLLREHMREAGTMRAALLRGPAGVGKTRLMAAALAETAGDVRVLSVKCQESGGAAFEAVRALFAPLGLTGPDPAGSPLLSGSARLALPALAPDREGGASPAGPADGYAVMHGLYWLAAGLAADEPLVLAVDDVQWCDEASLRWLGFLVRRAADLPIALFMTLRTETGTAAPGALDEIADAVACLTVDVAPLPYDAVREIVTAALGTEPAPAVVARCLEITGGTPFLVHLLAGELAELAPGGAPDAAALPDGFGRRAVARFHIDRLTPGQSAVARAAAILETDDPALIAALAGTRPGLARRALEDLRDLGLLLPGSLGYRHDLIRQAVLDAVPPAELDDLRERAARLLNDSHSSAEQVALQLMRLPEIPEPWMVTALRSAALGAEQRGAPAVAGQYLTRALRHDPDDVELLSASARALAHSDSGAALSRLEHALTLVTEPRTRCRLILQYVVTALGAYRSPRAFELANEALELCATQLGDSPADQALRTRVEAMVLVAGLDEKTTVRQVGERFRDRTPPAGETAEERLLLGMLCALGTLEGRAAAEVVPAAGRVLCVGDVSLGGWGALGASLTLYLADEIKPVDLALTALLEQSRIRGEAWTCGVASSTRAQMHLWAGNITQALSDAQLAFDLVHRLLRVSSAVGPQCALAEALVHRGDPHRAQELVDLVARPGLDRFALEYHTYLMARGRVRAALGDLEGALHHLTRCGDSLADAGIGNPVLAPWWFDAVQILAGLGRPEEGRAVVERVAPSVRRWGTPRALGMLHLCRGVLAPGAAGVEELTEAARLLENSAGQLESARAEHLLGRRLLDHGDAAGARERLRRSVDAAVRCGSKLLLDQAVAALSAAGGRLRHSTQSPTEALSGSERQIAERAAAGATNREIAESLFLTQRTVEFHLTSVYRKLGIGGRQELADALDRAWEPAQ